jgi:hypothetical protein
MAHALFRFYRSAKELQRQVQGETLCGERESWKSREYDKLMGHIDQQDGLRSIFAVDSLTAWSWLDLPLAVHQKRLLVIGIFL